MDFVDVKSFIPFYYGSLVNQTSVMWSLAWDLVMLRAVNSRQIKKDGTNKGKFKTQMFWLLFYAAVYSAVYFFAINKLYGVLQMAVVLTIPILNMYNGKRGTSQRVNRFMKWFFYLYYPLHLFVIGVFQAMR